MESRPAIHCDVLCLYAYNEFKTFFVIRLSEALENGGINQANKKNEIDLYLDDRKSPVVYSQVNNPEFRNVKISR